MIKDLKAEREEPHGWLEGELPGRESKSKGPEVDHAWCVRRTVRGPVWLDWQKQEIAEVGARVVTEARTTWSLAGNAGVFSFFSMTWEQRRDWIGLRLLQDSFYC